MAIMISYKSYGKSNLKLLYMTTLIAICILGAVLFMACAVAVKLTKEDEVSASSSMNKTDAQEDRAEEEKEWEHMSYPHPYLDGGALLGDPFNPFNVL